MVSIETSIGLAFDIGINNVFNLDMQNPTSSRKDETLCQIYMYNFSYIISEPTHFTESSSSLIDLFW